MKGVSLADIFAHKLALGTDVQDEDKHPEKSTTMAWGGEQNYNLVLSEINEKLLNAVLPDVYKRLNSRPQR